MASPGTRMLMGFPLHRCGGAGHGTLGRQAPATPPWVRLRNLPLKPSEPPCTALQKVAQFLMATRPKTSQQHGLLQDCPTQPGAVLFGVKETIPIPERHLALLVWWVGTSGWLSSQSCWLGAKSNGGRMSLQICPVVAERAACDACCGAWWPCVKSL